MAVANCSNGLIIGGAMQSPGAHSLEHVRRQQQLHLMDPRRRQAALSFLTNISLDGRPLQEYCGAQPKSEAGAAESSVQHLQGKQPSAPLPVSTAHVPQSRGSRASQQLVPVCSAGALHEDEEEEVQGSRLELAEAEDAFSSVPLTTVSRGRLNSFTYGILPAAFTRTSCPDPLQALLSDIPRSR